MGDRVSIEMLGPIIVVHDNFHLFDDNDGECAMKSEEWKCNKGWLLYWLAEYHKDIEDTQRYKGSLKQITDVCNKYWKPWYNCNSSWTFNQSEKHIEKVTVHLKAVSIRLFITWNLYNSMTKKGMLYDLELMLKH